MRVRMRDVPKIPTPPAYRRDPLIKTCHPIQNIHINRPKNIGVSKPPEAKEAMVELKTVPHKAREYQFRYPCNLDNEREIFSRAAKPKA